LASRRAFRTMAINKKSAMSVNSADTEHLLPGDFGDDEDRAPEGPCMALFRRGAAFLSLMCMMAAWIAEGEIVQFLNAPTDTKVTFGSSTFYGLNYNNNFFVSYCTRVGWSMVLVAWFVWSSCIFDGRSTSYTAIGFFSWRTYLKWGVGMGLGIFASTYTFYVSLEGTTVAGNSAVYQSAPVFVFLISVPLLKEKVTFLKVFAVALCVGGSAVVALLGAIDPNQMTADKLYQNTTIEVLNGMNTSSQLAASVGGDPSTPADLAGLANFGPLATSCYDICDGMACDAFSAVRRANSTVAQRWNCTLYSCGSGGCTPTSDYSGPASVAELLKPVKEENTPTGYAWCLASVVLYAAYEVLYKKYVCHPDDPLPLANSQRFFGLLGVLTCLTVWPFFFILNATEYEVFAWPTGPQWGVITLVAFCDTMFNIFLLITILLTSPLFTSVGTIMVIPLSNLVDYLAKDAVLPAKAFIGIGMICVGFSAIVYAESQHEEEDHGKKKEDQYA